MVPPPPCAGEIHLPRTPYQGDGGAVMHRVVERRNVGMVEPGLHLDLTLEPARLFGIVAHARREQLHRLDSPGDEVLDFVDGSHAAGADDIRHPVIVDYIAYTDRFHTKWIAKTRTIDAIARQRRPSSKGVRSGPPA